MFEIYNSNNKIPENRYLEMNDILMKDYIFIKGIEEYKKREKIFRKINLKPSFSSAKIILLIINM